MRKPTYLTRLAHVSELSEAERAGLKPVEEKFIFRSNDYYQGLIDWNDPEDPIRRIIMPMSGELEEWGELDASDEEEYTVLPGLQHKYRETALLLVNDVCGAYCRFCFRKRLFMDDNDEAVRDVSRGLEYIREHPEISNVLLTGGDPLLMSTEKLSAVIGRLRELRNVRIIRIGTKMPAFNPARILNDPALVELIGRHSTGEGKIYIMAHFNHPRELTDVAVEGMMLLQRAGATTVNQTPLIRGVNDDPATLAELFNRLSFIGVPPYYVFQCRPTLGNKPYSVPVERSYEIFSQAQARCSGLAKRARFVMSHASGKVEVVGLDAGHVYMKYHQAAKPSDQGRFLVLKRNPTAHWLDDYGAEAAAAAGGAELVETAAGSRAFGETRVGG
jgi:lysine 2,3-aminomutase